MTNRLLLSLVAYATGFSLFVLTDGWLSTGIAAGLLGVGLILTITGDQR